MMDSTAPQSSPLSSTLILETEWGRVHFDQLNLSDPNAHDCDHVKIHTPQAIQPYGCMVVLSDPELEIVQVSANLGEFWGVEPADIWDTTLDQWLDAATYDQIRQGLQGDFAAISPLPIQMGDRPLNAILHRAASGSIILECEPRNPNAQGDFFDFYRLAYPSLQRLRSAHTLTELSNLIAAEIRRLSGFDRVMVYRFGSDQAGQVIAEAKRDDLVSYQGLHYPATDIPKPARRLFSVNPIRTIPDATYAPVPLVSHPDRAELPPLNLTHSSLRSVFPFHLLYLHNMGVAASMTISLLKEGRLWGLIACHHETPRLVTYDLRTVCAFLGQAFALELTAKEDHEQLDAKLQLRRVQSRFIDQVSQADNCLTSLASDRDGLLQMVNATGAAIYSDGDIITVGVTPSDMEIAQLVDWLQHRKTGDWWSTDALAKVYPPAAQWQAMASGLLMLAITRIRKNYVLWFRPEQLQYVTWAGEPMPAEDRAPEGVGMLMPRRSFEAWCETVRGKSQPWQPCEVEGAIELRSAIVGIVMRQADELAALNLELQRSNTELDAFAYIASHDLKEPLRGIHNYATFLLEDYGEHLAADGTQKLETLLRLSRRMEDLIEALLHFSRLGRQDIELRPVDLNDLIQTVIEVFSVSQNVDALDIRIPESLPVVQGDRILLEEVMTNLFTNALKYNDRPDKWIEVGVTQQASPVLLTRREHTYVTLYVRDNGIGIRDRHLESIFRIFKRLHGPGKYGGGTGAGLTIVKKIIERHGGQIWVESQYGHGCTFYFTLPQ